MRATPVFDIADGRMRRMENPPVLKWPDHRPDSGYGRITTERQRLCQVFLIPARGAYQVHHGYINSGQPCYQALRLRCPKIASISAGAALSVKCPQKCFAGLDEFSLDKDLYL